MIEYTPLTVVAVMSKTERDDSFTLSFFVAIAKIQIQRRLIIMPKTKLQEVIFTVFMVIVMVYTMVCYNIAFAMGGMQNKVFVAALSEMPIMCAIGFVLDMLISGPLAKKCAFKVVNPQKDRTIFIILAISVFSILFMCPMMSFAATILFNGGFNSEIVATWAGLTVKNFPMAFFWQLFVAGPLVRFIFGKIFREKSKKAEK